MTKNKKKTELVTVKPGFSLIDENLLKSRIYTIRGVKVMLDADLAEIYGYSTGAFNQQVKNNIEKFDDDFRFQITQTEFAGLISKFLISNRGGTRKMPYAFTEQGIYMLMTVLKGESRSHARTDMTEPSIWRLRTGGKRILHNYTKDFVCVLEQKKLRNCFPHICDKLIQRPNVIATFFWICLYIRFWNNQPNFFGLHFI